MQNQTRIIIENIKPQLDGGAFFIKRIVGQKVKVTSNVFSDGHDVVECCVKYKHEKEKSIYTFCHGCNGRLAFQRCNNFLQQE